MDAGAMGDSVQLNPQFFWRPQTGGRGFGRMRRLRRKVGEARRGNASGSAAGLVVAGWWVPRPTRSLCGVVKWEPGSRLERLHRWGGERWLWRDERGRVVGGRTLLGGGTSWFQTSTLSGFTMHNR